MTRFSAWFSLFVLMACGSGSSPPTAPATPGPAPVPVDYNGTYVGAAMTWQDPYRSLSVTASCTVSQTGAQLLFDHMSVITPLQGSTPVPYRQVYAMGPAILVGNLFDHTREFLRPGCGQVTSHYRGSFSADGEVMTITMTYIASGCEKFEISGEMRRVRL